LAINLAVAAKEHFDRVLLVDADLVRGDIATMLQLHGRYDLDDVLAGNCSLQQAMVMGPAGIQIIPRLADRSHASLRLQPIKRQLSQLGNRFDLVVLDGGCSPAASEILWPLADRGVVVSTPDAVAVTNSYRLLKSLAQQHGLPPIVNSFVNCVDDEALANDVQQRLRQTCDRFLKITLEPLGMLSFDQCWRDASLADRPVVVGPASSDAFLAVQAMAALIAERSSQHTQQRTAPAPVHTTHATQVGLRAASTA
jgi:flagellar biosynthesis protein FlhG